MCFLARRGRQSAHVDRLALQLDAACFTGAAALPRCLPALIAPHAGLRPQAVPRHPTPPPHPQFNLHRQPLKYAPTCEVGGLSFWAHELFRQVIPWSALFALCFALPLHHAAPAQAAAAALVLLPRNARTLRQLSSELCPDAEARYASAAWALGLDGLHPPVPLLGGFAGSDAAGPGEAYHVLTTLCVFLLSLLAPLEVTKRRQRAARRQFASARGMSAAATAQLMQVGDRRASLVLLVLAACLPAAAALAAYTGGTLVAARVAYSLMQLLCLHFALAACVG